MPTATVDVGAGSTVSFTDTSFTSELLSIAFTGGTRPSIKTTHLATAQADVTMTEFGGDTFIPGSFADPGQLDLEFHFDPDKISVDPILNTASEAITVQITDGTVKATWTMSGFCTSQDINIAVADTEEKMTMSTSWKLTGVVKAVIGA